jgi:flagellar biosynthesis protein FlhF
MAQAREELGSDALLMNTRRALPEAMHIGEFEAVFALADEPAAAEAEIFARTSDGDRLAEEIAELRRQMEQMTSRFQRSNMVSVSNLLSNPELADIFSSLIGSDVSAALAQEIIGTLRTRSDLRTGVLAHRAVREEVASLFQVDESSGKSSELRKVVALVGPSGAGKTTMLAKLAVRFGLMAKRPMQILTTDVDRIAAADQLQTYATIFGTGFHAVESPHALRQALDEHKLKSLVLIDTPGYAPSEMGDAEDFARAFTANPEIDVHLVLPATMKSGDLSRAVDRFEMFGAAKLAFTRLDETATYGTLLNEAARTGKPVSFLSTGPNVPDDLQMPSQSDLVDLILGHCSLKVAAVA